MRAGSLRWRLARRRPVVFWSFATLVAAATGLGAAAFVHDAEQQAAAWGPGPAVAVARHDLAVGSVVGPDDVQFEPRPAALVPVGAVDERAVLTGRTVLDPIVRGEVLVGTRLAPDGVRGLAALLPRDTLAVLIPPTAKPPRVLVHDVVDLLTGPGPSTAPGGGTEIARAALVIDVADDGGLTVAVPRGRAPAAAAAVLDDSIVVALAPRP